MCSWAQLLSRVRLFGTPWTPWTPWTVAHQACLESSRQIILESVAISYPRGSSWPRDQTCVPYISYIGRQILYHWITWETQSFVWNHPFQETWYSQILQWCSWKIGNVLFVLYKTNTISSIQICYSQEEIGLEIFASLITSHIYL